MQLLTGQDVNERRAFVPPASLRRVDRICPDSRLPRRPRPAPENRLCRPGTRAIVGARRDRSIRQRLLSVERGGICVCAAVYGHRRIAAYAHARPCPLCQPGSVRRHSLRRRDRRNHSGRRPRSAGRRARQENPSRQHPDRITGGSREARFAVRRDRRFPLVRSRSTSCGFQRPDTIRAEHADGVGLGFCIFPVFRHRGGELGDDGRRAASLQFPDRARCHRLDFLRQDARRFGRGVGCGDRGERGGTCGLICIRSADGCSDGDGVRAFSCACGHCQGAHVCQSAAAQSKPESRCPRRACADARFCLGVEPMADAQSDGRSAACCHFRRRERTRPREFSRHERARHIR